MAKKTASKAPFLGDEAPRQGIGPVTALLERLAESGDVTIERIRREGKDVLDATPLRVTLFAREVVRRLDREHGEEDGPSTRLALEKLLLLLVSDTDDVAPETVLVAADYYARQVPSPDDDDPFGAAQERPRSHVRLAFENNPIWATVNQIDALAEEGELSPSL